MSTPASPAEIRIQVDQARAVAPWIEPEVADRFAAASMTLEQVNAHLFDMVTDEAALATSIVTAYRGPAKPVNDNARNH